MQGNIFICRYSFYQPFKHAHSVCVLTSSLQTLCQVVSHKTYCLHPY